MLEVNGAITLGVVGSELLYSVLIRGLLSTLDGSPLALGFSQGVLNLLLVLECCPRSDLTIGIDDRLVGMTVGGGPGFASETLFDLEGIEPCDFRDAID